MRVVIDMQGAQGTSRLRGIGRYTFELAQAMARNRGDHEIILVLSDLFPDTILELRDRFHGLLRPSAIRVWTAPGPVRAADPENVERRRQAEQIREAFIASLDPDVVLVASLFEGLHEDVVTSVQTDGGIRTAVVLYDLIPLNRPDMHLPKKTTKDWYFQKIENLRRADLLLSISESAGSEAVEHLSWVPDRAVNISTAASELFQPVEVSSDDERSLKDRFGIRKAYLLYTGGIDPRKNIDALIDAFARLNEKVRSAHQLVIVCNASEKQKARLSKVVRKIGLLDQDIILTDRVSDKELLHLYNLCAAFVFPSLHEGFGLPALEAMQSGAAVIASDRSSLPEVIGRPDALFDPEDIDGMAQKIEQVLSDTAFRHALREHGTEQAKRFSWDRTAMAALSALERVCSDPGNADITDAERPRLAFVSPLPPERSGISDYSAELLPVLHEHYDIDVIVAQDSVANAWINDNLTIRTADWFEENHSDYDRIVYHFGNSHFHRHMFGLLRKTSGVVVLHDFFLAHVLAHLWPASWKEELFHSHGFNALFMASEATDEYDAIWRYPANLSVLQSAIGIIVHSDHARRLAARYYGEGAERGFSVVPQLRAPADRIAAAKAQAKAALGLPEKSLVICSFGVIGPIKLNVRLAEAFCASSLASDSNVYLVFVGENNEDDYSKQLARIIRTSGLSDRVRITGWVDAGTFAQYLQAADIAVQLRTNSRGETSRAVLDCMAHGIPTIVNANGSMAELDPKSVWMLPDDFETAALSSALEELAVDASSRANLGERALDVICTLHAPERCAKAHFEAIERAYAGASARVQNLVDTLPAPAASDDEIRRLAGALSANFPARPRKRGLFVDVSTLAQTDALTGIQRVVRAILDALVRKPDPEFDILPVRRRADHRYGIAIDLMAHRLGLDAGAWDDQPIDFALGDVFLGLDLDPVCPPIARAELERMRRFGVAVHFVVYDLLALKQPQNFPKPLVAKFRHWLDRVLTYDGAVCISRAVADELREWSDLHGPDRRKPFEISFFHLGADIKNSRPSTGMPDDGRALLTSLGDRPTFLIVGTVEPRKGVRQVLDAFELLWSSGTDVNLVIVGKQGWSVDDLAKRLRRHPENGRRLFWPEAVSDEFLEMIYGRCTCLIAASEGEGFGLPVIEAAQHKLPILARELPVFHEVALDHATYFTGLAPSDLIDAIERWLEGWRRGEHVRSDELPWITWETSAAQLLEAVHVLSPLGSVTGRSRS